MSQTKKYIFIHRLVILCAFIMLATATIMSFILEQDALTLLPKAKMLVPFLYGLSACLCLLLILYPEKLKLEIAILSIQSFLTIWTGRELLGIFIYSAMIMTLFCNDFFKTDARKKVLFFLIIINLLLVGLYPYGIHRIIIAYVVLILKILFYINMYMKLKNILAPFLPPQIILTREKLPLPGGMLKLSKFNLSPRQIIIIKECFLEGCSYKEIAFKHSLSLSTVKQDMAKAFKIFEVNTREELRILLLQYKIK